jgi:hypothetical protein
MKLKTTVLSAIFVFAMGLLLGTSAVQAANVIFDSSDSTKAIGIENLDILGELYNVTFTPPSTAAVTVYGPFPGTYDFDTTSEALEAVQTVNDALNINGAQTVGVAGLKGVPFYRVGFASDSSPELKAVIFWEAVKGKGELDPWRKTVNPDADSYSLGVRVWAEFTLVDPTYDATGIWQIEGQEDYFFVKTNGSNMVGVTYFPGAEQSFWMGSGVENDWYIYYASNLTEFEAYFVLTSDTTGMMAVLACSPSSECLIPVGPAVHVRKVF